MKKTLLLISILTTLPIGSAFAHGAGNGPDRDRNDRSQGIADFMAGKKGGCNPLDANACDKNQVCWSDASIEEIINNSSKYKCQNQNQCGDGATCVALDGFSSQGPSGSQPATPSGSAGSGPLQVCIPKGQCVDTALHAQFEAFIPSEYQFDLDLKKCVGKLTNKETQMPDNTKVEQYTTEVMHFTMVLEHATVAMDDWFGINKQGKAFAVTFNERRAAAQEAYLAAKEKLQKYLEKIKTAAANNEIDISSSVAYYGVMAEIYELEAHVSAEFVSQFAEVYSDLDKWMDYIANPKPDYYAVGNGDRGLGILIGTIRSESNESDSDDDQRAVQKEETETDISQSIDTDKRDATLTSKVPVYQLKKNQCGMIGKRNGDCVKMCEHEGIPVVDPVIETEKVKKDPGFLGLGRLFCGIGNALSSMFGSGKKEDCKYEYIEQIPDHFAQYSNSAVCSYIAKEPSKSAAQNKIKTVNIIREKVANLTNYYEASYKMNTELAGCMKLIAGEVSSAYDGGFSGDLSGDGNSNNNNEAPKGANGSVDLSGSAVNNVGSPISGGSGALSAYRQRLQQALKERNGSSSSLEAAGLDPLSSEKGKNALNRKLSKFAKERAESQKKSSRFVNAAKNGAAGNSAFQSIQDFRQVASNLNVAVDESKSADPFSFGSLNPADFVKSNSLVSSTSDANGKNSDSLSGSNANGSGSLNGNASGSKAALANAKNAQAAAAAANSEAEKARKLRLSKRGSSQGGANAMGAIDGSLINGDASSDDENGKKKVAKSDEAKEGEEVLEAETKTDVPLPPNFDEYDLANMLNDVQSDQYKYSRRADDSLWDIITKTYMRSAIKTIYGDRASSAEPKEN